MVRQAGPIATSWPLALLKIQRKLDLFELDVFRFGERAFILYALILIKNTMMIYQALSSLSSSSSSLLVPPRPSSSSSSSASASASASSRARNHETSTFFMCLAFNSALAPSGFPGCGGDARLPPAAWLVHVPYLPRKTRC